VKAQFDDSQYPAWQRFLYGAALAAAVIVSYLIGITVACPRTRGDIIYVPAFLGVYSFIWIPAMALCGVFVMIITSHIVRSRKGSMLGTAMLVALSAAVLVAVLLQPHPCRGGW
jgi:hypothetical protein